MQSAKYIMHDVQITQRLRRLVSKPIIHPSNIWNKKLVSRRILCFRMTPPCLPCLFFLVHSSIIVRPHYSSRESTQQNLKFVISEQKSFQSHCFKLSNKGRLVASVFSFSVEKIWNKAPSFKQFIVDYWFTCAKYTCDNSWRFGDQKYQYEHINRSSGFRIHQ